MKVGDIVEYLNCLGRIIDITTNQKNLITTRVMIADNLNIITGVYGVSDCKKIKPASKENTHRFLVWCSGNYIRSA